jgi:hypothetical protein
MSKRHKRPFFHDWLFDHMGHDWYYGWPPSRFVDRLALDNGKMTPTEYLAKWCKDKDDV